MCIITIMPRRIQEQTCGTNWPPRLRRLPRFNFDHCGHKLQNSQREQQNGGAIFPAWLVNHFIKNRCDLSWVIGRTRERNPTEEELKQGLAYGVAT